MEEDPLSLPNTPPAKRTSSRRNRSSPYKDLLAKFGAQPTPSSVSKIARSGSGTLRPMADVSYAESEASTSPSTSTSQESSQFDSPSLTQKSGDTGITHSPVDDDGNPDDEHHELQSGDEIRVASHPSSTTTRRNPSRAARNPTAKRKAAPGVRKLRKTTKSKKLLKSDSSVSFVTGFGAESGLAVGTEEPSHSLKARHEAFLLANKDYFIPLLPENSYIHKLLRTHESHNVTDGDSDFARGKAEALPYITITEQPMKITATMKPYQLEGLSFLVYMHNNGMSAILGDEMGLGKTLQTLSLLVHVDAMKTSSQCTRRPNLVVCPLSVLSSWVSETKKWCPHLRVLRFHGSKTERDRFKRETVGMVDRCGKMRGAGSERAGQPLSQEAGDVTSVDIVITSYETFNSEQGWFKHGTRWQYCVLDEGHKIKNKKSNIAAALQGIKAEHRLLLTGTPLQNNLHEMWALLHWLYPDIFTANTGDMFKEAFNLSKGHISTTFMDDSRRLLELIMLRRMKSSPGVNLGLPPKEEVLLYVPLTPMQRFWYTRLLTGAGDAVLDDLFRNVKSKEQQMLRQNAEEEKRLTVLENMASQSEIDNPDVWTESKDIIQQAMLHETQDERKKSDWNRLMNLLIQLRKACTHPYILPNASPEPYYVGDHVRTASGKFIVLQKLVDELVVKKGKKILIFSGWTRVLDLCEDLLNSQGAGSPDPPFRYLRFDGGTGRARRNAGIRMFNDMKSNFKVLLISTRAGGLGINLASATEVVFLDEDWNPQITLQAEARAHRIGQNQKVTVYKLCTQGTVEEQMMGRIRKKLYLSAKVTENMQNIHTTGESPKRVRTPGSDGSENDARALGAIELKSLIRRGAQTLTRPQIDVTEMLGWDWETTLQKCKDEACSVDAGDKTTEEEEEQKWLNSIEKVETAVFEGTKHHKQLEMEMENEVLTRDHRRLGKNTTVMVGGFAVSKESMMCGDWEAVPTLAGKDPRLAEPKREKKADIQHQAHCQICRLSTDEPYVCSSCPRSYHYKCLSPEMHSKIRGKKGFFYCSQHECFDCAKKTGDAGGMLYRCRWCEKAYCEDCLDFDNVTLLENFPPELDMLGFAQNDNAWFVECPACMENWKLDPADRKRCMSEQEGIEDEYADFLVEHGQARPSKKRTVTAAEMEPQAGMKKTKVDGSSPDFVDLTRTDTPDTVSEVQTPANGDPMDTDISDVAKLDLTSALENGLSGTFRI